MRLVILIILREAMLKKVGHGDLKINCRTDVFFVGLMGFSVGLMGYCVGWMGFGLMSKCVGLLGKFVGLMGVGLMVVGLLGCTHFL